jgi:hypothetical protein
MLELLGDVAEIFFGKLDILEGIVYNFRKIK